MKKACIFALLLLFGISLIVAAECGDVNSDGTIDILDALLIAQYYVGLNPSNFDSTAADVNSDNSIDIVDALLIAQLYVGLIDNLPGCPTTTPVPIEPETVFAVNCGGSAYTTSDGTEYAADTGYSGGTAYDNGASVSGTSDPTLYSTERYGSCTYSASVPNGDYLVTLHFAENYHTSSGSRSFNVLMEGTQVISNLDIYAEAGANTAYVTKNQIAVSDGEINIEFVTVTENALINAIKVSAISFTGEPVVNFTVSPSNPKPGETITVDASASYDPDGSITNYQVNWGDGATTNGSVTSHTYQNEGTYTITVTVTDNEGKTASASEDILVSSATPTPIPGDISVPNGYAEGTTGGGNASTQTVSSASTFKSAVSGNSSKVIIVDGRFDLGGSVEIGSNTTIKGANSNSGLYGGTVKIEGTNYIIQNLTFGPSDGDVMEVSGATKVFIHKCTFHDSTDELCSIVRQADYVTVSWCRFYFDNPDSHSYAHLIGNSDDATDDRGKLHVTLHHNWYDNGVKGRMPRVRFGYIHIYNCYYSSNNTDYCIGAGKECHIRVENSHFDNVDDPWDDYGAPESGGQIGWSNLKFEGCSQPTFMSNSFPVFDPPYSFDMDPVDNVESIVRNGAGNR